MARYLVTGALGFIGTHLCRTLLNQGHDVIGIDNFTNEEYCQSNLDSLKHYRNFAHIVADVRELAELDMEHRTNYIQGIFHLAAVPRVQLSFDEPMRTNDHNIASTLAVLEFARKNKIDKVVYASSSTAKTLMSPYGIQKRTGEMYCKLYKDHLGVNVVSLRYFSVYGPGMDEKHGYALLVPKLIDCALNNEKFTLYGDGSIERDFTFIDDVIDATIRVMEMDVDVDEPLEVGKEDPHSVQEIIDLVSQLSDNKIFINPQPPRIEQQISLAESKTLREKFGWNPQVSIKEGIRRMIEAKKNGTA